jgi:hypothetical protein
MPFKCKLVRDTHFAQNPWKRTQKFYSRDNISLTYLHVNGISSHTYPKKRSTKSYLQTAGNCSDKSNTTITPHQRGTATPSLIREEGGGGFEEKGLIVRLRIGIPGQFWDELCVAHETS